MRWDIVLLRGFQWWKKASEDKEAGSTSARICEKGHAMDPNWETCAYCEAEIRASRKSAAGATDAESVEPRNSEQRITQMERSRTVIDSGPGEAEERLDKTLVGTSADPTERTSARSAATKRKIMGILVTYTWRPKEGELFVLYEGRNIIGSGESCDVRIPTDKMMSDRHAVILFRLEERVEIYDEHSTNGTFVNEKFVEREGADLADGASIKAGATIFEFRKFESAGKRSPGSAGSGKEGQTHSGGSLHDPSF